MKTDEEMKAPNMSRECIRDVVPDTPHESGSQYVLLHYCAWDILDGPHSGHLVCIGRTDFGHTFCPVCNLPFVFLAVRSRSIGAQFVVCKLIIPFYSKLNEEGADPEGYAHLVTA